MAGPDWITWRDDRRPLAKRFDTALITAAAIVSVTITLMPWAVGIYTLVHWVVGGPHD